MEKNEYYVNISIKSGIAFAFCMIGLIYFVRGMIADYNLRIIKESYEEVEIKKSHYVARDIFLEQLMGSYATEMNGKIYYSPICCINAVTEERKYIIPINKSADYYITLIVPYKYTEQFDEMTDGKREKYCFIGKIEKLEGNLYYDIISEVTGVSNTALIEKMVSPKYAIKIVDVKEEKLIVWKGIVLLACGVLLFSMSIEIKRVQ